MYEKRYRRQVLELRRQEKVRQGWLVLREVAGSMQKGSVSVDAFLKDFEGRLKGLLAERSTRTHPALGLFKSTASWIQKTGNMDYGVGLFLRAGPF